MIKVHQGTFGDKDGGHFLLKSSFENDRIPNQISGITDLVDRPPSGLLLEPIIRGEMIGDYFLLMKTFSDISSGVREGRVFTHALIIKKQDYLRIHRLFDLLQFHLIEVDKEADLSIIEFDNKPANKKEYILNGRIKAAINGLVSIEEYDNSVIFTGRHDYENWINIVWSQLPNNTKLNLRIGGAFDPRYVKERQITLAYIPRELKSNWQNFNFKIITQETSEVLISQSSYYLAGSVKPDDELMSLILDLNIEIQKLGDFKLFESYIKLYKGLAVTDDIRELLVFTDLVSRKSLKKDSSDGKLNILNSIGRLIVNANPLEINALQYQTWKGFDNALDIIQPKLNKWLVSNLFSSVELETTLRLIKSAYSDDSGWWGQQIRDFINASIEGRGDGYSIAIWDWVLFEPDILSILEPSLPPSNEKDFSDKLPSEISNIKDSLIEFCNRQNWLLLHAKVISRFYNLDESIEKQLKIDINPTSYEGLKIIASSFPSDLFLEYFISNPSKRLTSIATNLIIDKPELFSKIDLQNKKWIELWQLCEENGVSPYKYVADPNELVFELLNNLIEGKTVTHSLLNAISVSGYNDLSGYANRSKLWKLLRDQQKKNFIDATADLHEIEKHLLITNSIIAESGLDSSDSNEKYFIELNKIHSTIPIEIVLDVIDVFSINEKDTLSYLDSKVKLFSGKEIEKLARIVVSHKWESIYNKIRNTYIHQNGGFSIAVEIGKGHFSILWRTSKKLSPNSNEEPINGNINMTEKLPIIIILTAIVEEYNAVMKHLVDIEDADIDDTVYEKGTFKFGEESIATVIVRECGAGNNIASQETERAIQYFKPQGMLFVGIAGSRKPNDFGIGDVIIPKKIYSYEAGRAEKVKFLARPDLVSASYALNERAKKERNRDDWKVMIKRGLENDVKAGIGIIASGEQLIEHYDSTIGEIITNHYNDTSAVEMEGFGFANALQNQGRSKGNIVYGVVRGISDIIKKENDESLVGNNDRRPDGVKELASDTASAFAFWLVYKLFPKSSN